MISAGERLQDLPCDPGASSGIRKGVVLTLELVAALGRHGQKFVVGQVWKRFAGGLQGVIDFISGVFHLVDMEDGFQGPFVDGFVMCHQG